jgi:hypothetical protein
VQLQDDAAVDGLARDLARLLPQMKGDWTAIAATPPGPAKRFAIFFAMAKIPGLDVDLVSYTRPQGTIAKFQGYWKDWTILPRGRTLATTAPPHPSAYARDGVYYGDGDDQDDGGRSDLTCLGECGLGAFPLRLPGFVAAGQAKARAERGAFVDDAYLPDGATRALPKGSLNAWEELLAYARAHPDDPRAPEALYWLIHVTHLGPNNNRMSYRAFKQLHSRYPKSSWAKRAPYYY